jgi:hypothetical protein
MPDSDAHGTMTNFQYDVTLDPSQFSVEPPKDYMVQNMDVTMPTESDLISLLRLVAGHNKGLFPSAIGMMNKEIQQAMAAAAKPEMEKMKPEIDKAKKKYGKDSREVTMIVISAGMKQQKYMQGVMFFASLKAESDAHYAGRGVKLGTPDRAIFWYKPTGSEKYHVLYADLSVKEMDAAAVKNLK